LQLVPFFGKVSNAVFNHDHGRIDDEPEVDCTEAHEVRRDSEILHPDNRHEHSNGNCGGNYQPGADLEQKQKQNDYDKQSAFDNAPDAVIKIPATDKSV